MPAETRWPATEAPVMSNAALGISAIVSTRIRIVDVQLLRHGFLRRARASESLVINVRNPLAGRSHN